MELLCLEKIRTNRLFCELADRFGRSLSYASKIFFGSILLLAGVLHPLLVALGKGTIQKKLPIDFRYRYKNVNSQINCMVINIRNLIKAFHHTVA